MNKVFKGGTFVNAKRHASVACERRVRGRKTSGTSFSNSAIFGQTAISSGEIGAKVRLYQGMIEVEKILSVEEADERLRWSQIDRTGGKRGKVNAWSNKSRYRCLELLGRVGRLDHPLMVTLTYRKEVSAETSKLDLHDFQVWLKRNWDACGVWRFELQRGVHKNPHFHVLAWGECANLRGEAEFREMEHQLKAKWCKITGDGGEHRMMYGCHVQQSDGSNKAKNYLVGHTVKKSEQEAYGKGRHWGVFNRKALRLGEPIESMVISVHQLALFRRLCSKLIQARRKWGGKYKLGRRRKTHLVLDRYQQRKMWAWIFESS